MASKKFTDELDAAIDYGVDVVGRRVFLHGGIEDKAIGRVIRGMYVLSDLGPKEPVELFITSYGGEIDESFALHDVTRTLRCPVHTVALGKCMSAAPILVAAGTKGHRYASENCLFMMHDCYLDEVQGSPGQIRTEVEAAAMQMQKMAELLGEYTKKPKSHWEKIFRSKNDKYFTADQALEWGIVDQLWSEK